MIPTVPSDHVPHPPTDAPGAPIFLDDAYNAGADGDWWLDLGAVDLPQSCAV